MALVSLSNGWKASANALSSKLSEKVENFLKNHAGADLFIVTGCTGVGKSSFIKCITREDVYVGSTLKSGTTTISLVPVVIGNRRCLFMDVPGFNTRDFDDWDVFERLMTGMSIVQPYVQFRGVLYVDSMENNRGTPAAEKILNWLYYFCGKDYMSNVTVITTRWDGLDADGIEDKLSRFKQWEADRLFRALFDNGAKVYHHGLLKEGNSFKTLHIERQFERRRSLALTMIMSCYHGPTSPQLQIHAEIANGASLERTSAGRWLREGHTGNSHFQSDASSTPPNENGSASAEGQRQHDPADQQCGDDDNDDGAHATPGWGAQFAEFMTDPQRITPWIKLLGRAAWKFWRASMSPTFRPSPPTFFDDDFPGPFHADDDFFYDFFVPDDLPDMSSGLNDPVNDYSFRTEPDSGWSCPIL
ncbi:hypothetical protein BJX63DRAFT_433323 [Aspergillus granulosus]|uniref:G domain-containing protein n=1 Tax=Aspergillus granulosus TaxID=176169 RepID=A0ABR4H7P1_9EURO